MSLIDFTLAEASPLFPKPIVLSIGTFDGVHLGHQALVHAGKEEAKKTHTEFIVLTFKTPPSWFFSKEKKELLIPLEKRIELLHNYGADHVLLMDFNGEIASLTVLEFLSLLKEKLPLGKLILGYDSQLGSDRENNREKVLNAAEKLEIGVEFLPPTKVDDEIVSSTLIRKSKEARDLAKVNQLLGHNS